ncbi:MAG: hypothetical protein OJF60_001581 [Burkholderiaceae bacterium]|nr:MAG: hypothetical protein OJF60_001581 [Burkholderiaceae bacterium]
MKPGARNAAHLLRPRRGAAGAWQGSAIDSFIKEMEHEQA